MKVSNGPATVMRILYSQSQITCVVCLSLILRAMEKDLRGFIYDATILQPRKVAFLMGL